MDLTLFEELFQKKADAHVRAGSAYPEALRLAGEDLLRGAGHGRGEVEMFCLRALVAGACRRLARERA